MSSLLTGAPTQRHRCWRDVRVLRVGVPARRSRAWCVAHRLFWLYGNYQANVAEEQHPH